MTACAVWSLVWYHMFAMRSFRRSVCCDLVVGPTRLFKGKQRDHITGEQPDDQACAVKH